MAEESNDNIDQFRGNAVVYDVYRPWPPKVILDVLLDVASLERPSFVVDLGSGTGHSTFVWAERAGVVVGIEPNDEMRAVAEKRQTTLAYAGNVRIQKGVATATGLPDEYAHIVTCAQSLHWMEPDATFAEIARILRPGGIFAAYDYFWPPTVRWDVALAFSELLAQAKTAHFKRPVKLLRWSKDKHLQRMRDSGHFRHVQETYLHHCEVIAADHLIGLALSSGPVRTALKHGASEVELGIVDFRAKIKDIVGRGSIPCYFSYALRIGIK